MPELLVTDNLTFTPDYQNVFFAKIHVIAIYDVRYRTPWFLSFKKILISDFNKYLCLDIRQMKNIHIILAILLVSLVVLYR